MSGVFQTECAFSIIYIVVITIFHAKRIIYYIVSVATLGIEVKIKSLSDFLGAKRE